MMNSTRKEEDEQCDATVLRGAMNSGAMNSGAMNSEQRCCCCCDAEGEREMPGRDLLLLLFAAAAMSW